MTNSLDFLMGFAAGLEAAVKVAEGFPAHTHGNLATAPPQAAEQAADEIAAAIRDLYPTPDVVPVPREPTAKMIEAGIEVRWRRAACDANNVREIYRAMVGAREE